MKKFAVCLIPLALFFMVPLSAAVLVMAVGSPSVGEELKAQQCNGGALPASGPWRPPLQQAYTLTSGYGMRYHPILHVMKLHTGQDLAAQPAPGPVVAASDGRVVAAGYNSGYGNSVNLQHADGVSTLYAHLASIDDAMKAGADVAAGQVVGIEGSTGSSTGAHLHFEVKVNGVPIDPVPFMEEHGAPLNGRRVAPTPAPGSVAPPGAQEGGIGFALPEPGTPRQDSLHHAPTPIPAEIENLYVRVGGKYKIPWPLLAGIGMEETAHGANKSTSIAGAQGLMQFMPATFSSYGVDGDGDGRAVITNDADSVMSAANYLTASGVTRGPQGVRRALWAYNHANWYVNDVLYYAKAYGGGTVLGDPTDCGAGNGDPDLPPLTDERVKRMLSWSQEQLGEPYVFGANGPDAWDCSSFVQANYRQIGITVPRTAEAQRNWLANGNGFRVPEGQERPGDLVFTDTYRGPNLIGHVMVVLNPAEGASIEARGSAVRYDKYSRYADHNIYEIWRPGNVADQPSQAAS